MECGAASSIASGERSKSGECRGSWYRGSWRPKRGDQVSSPRRGPVQALLAWGVTQGVSERSTASEARRAPDLSGFQIPGGHRSHSRRSQVRHQVTH